MLSRITAIMKASYRPLSRSPSLDSSIIRAFSCSYLRFFAGPVSAFHSMFHAFFFLPALVVGMPVILAIFRFAFVTPRARFHLNPPHDMDNSPFLPRRCRARYKISELLEYKKELTIFVQNTILRISNSRAIIGLQKS